MPALKSRLALLFLLVCGYASADSWMPPREAQYLSADKATRVTITPRPLGGALPYFEDKVAGKEPAGQREGSDQTQPMAFLERRQGGRWQSVWKKPLVNDVGPVRALVANSGRYIVTFDNWHSAGHGTDVVVIYDAQGELIRKMALTDFLPAAYVASLPRTVSSLWWGGEHRLDNKNETLVLRVAEPGERIHGDSKRTVDVRVRLADGQVLAHEGADWTKAMATVKKLDEARQARWQALRVLRASPLSPPQGNDAKVWREYMVELRSRLNESSGHRHAGLVLSVPEDDNSVDSPEGIKRVLEEFVTDREFSSGYFVFVSPSSEALAGLLAKHLSSVKPQSMKGARISFVGTPEDAAKVKSAASRSGAEVVLIDKDVPFDGMTLADPMPEWFR